MLGLASVLPADVSVCEHRGTPVPDALFPAEEDSITGASPDRRREFAAGRSCARKAMIALGYPPRPIGVATSRAPVWPTDLRGSITHLADYVAAAVAPRERYHAIGIDAADTKPLPPGVFKLIARREEAARRRRDIDFYDCVIFSAKESVLKAWCGKTKRLLWWREIQITLDPYGFDASVYPTADARATLRGRYAIYDGLVLTAVVLTTGR